VVVVVMVVVVVVLQMSQDDMPNFRNKMILSIVKAALQ